jgi:hypothetical protein
MDEADEPEFNISRILRNNAVNSIWEGTTNVLASCQGIPQIHALNQGQGTVKPCSEYLQVVFLNKEACMLVS